MNFLSIQMEKKREMKKRQQLKHHPVTSLTTISRIWDLSVFLSLKNKSFKRKRYKFRFKQKDILFTVHCSLVNGRALNVNNKFPVRQIRPNATPLIISYRQMLFNPIQTGWIVYKKETTRDSIEFDEIKKVFRLKTDS